MLYLYLLINTFLLDLYSILVHAQVQILFQTLFCTKLNFRIKIKFLSTLTIKYAWDSSRPKSLKSRDCRYRKFEAQLPAVKAATQSRWEYALDNSKISTLVEKRGEGMLLIVTFGYNAHRNKFAAGAVHNWGHSSLSRAPLSLSLSLSCSFVSSAENIFQEQHERIISRR